MQTHWWDLGMRFLPLSVPYSPSTTPSPPTATLRGKVGRVVSGHASRGALFLARSNNAAQNVLSKNQIRLMILSGAVLVVVSLCTRLVYATCPPPPPTSTLTVACPFPMQQRPLASRTSVRPFPTDLFLTGSLRTHGVQAGAREVTSGYFMATPASAVWHGPSSMRQFPPPSSDAKQGQLQTQNMTQNSTRQLQCQHAQRREQPEIEARVYVRVCPRRIGAQKIV
mmetsp:Transcript_69298/g.115184  ORF Transcript_69298/g.115184 Transcript_69298/m.115184 type:complete len:225 (+) Transcript_69298:825-1499(+)